MEVLTAKYEFSEDTLKITLTGEIDHHTAKAVRMEIDGQIHTYCAKNVLIDLKNVGFMDSSGLGLIMGRYSRMRAIGGELSLRDPAERLLRIFVLSFARIWVM